MSYLNGMYHGNPLTIILGVEIINSTIVHLNVGEGKELSAFGLVYDFSIPLRICYNHNSPSNSHMKSTEIDYR